MDLETHFLTESRFSSGKERGAKTKESESDVGKPKVPKMGDSTPKKSGEILRTDFGQFSFSCTFCDTVCENCQEIMDHINSHFDTINSIEMSASPLPEFISTGEIQSDTDTMDTTIISKGQLKIRNKPSVSKITFGTSNTEGCNLKNSMDATKQIPTTRIVKITKGKRNISEMERPAEPISSTVLPPTAKTVRIIKLKRVKLIPTDKTCANKDKACTDSSQKSELRMPEDFAITESSPKIQLKPVVKDLIDISERRTYMRLPKRSCYQCEMEPRIFESTEPRRHICLFCPIWFPNHVDFELHVRQIHKKEPDYVSAKDFYCYVCERKFDFREYLTRHLKSHKETAEHLCATCGITFKERNRLTQHMKIHEDQTFECDQCGKVFKQFVRLRKHLWCHNTNLTFVCQVCSKAFKMKRYLDLHMAVHDEPKINCRHCDATFHFKSVRRAHEKSRHNVL